jgi:hypothetical protein
MASADQEAVMHLFPNFPLEIQLKIWRHTIPGTRVVSIRYDADDGAYTSSANPPVALFVCKQSREEAKRFWQLTFGSTIDNGRIWVSFDIDQVLFRIHCSWGQTEDDNVGYYSLDKIGPFVSHAKGVERIKLFAVHHPIATCIEEAEAHPKLRSWIKDFYSRMPSLE